MNEDMTNEVLEDVFKERERQYALYGDQADLSWAEQLTILVEEVGELAQALQRKMKMDSVKDSDEDDADAEGIQVAAVAVKIVELLRQHRE